MSFLICKNRPKNFARKLISLGEFRRKKLGETRRKTPKRNSAIFAYFRFASLRFASPRWKNFRLEVAEPKKNFASPHSKIKIFAFAPRAPGISRRIYISALSKTMTTGVCDTRNISSFYGSIELAAENFLE